MLEFSLVNHPDQVLKRLSEFDPAKDTWIVSDLKSKQEVQQQCISKQKFYTDDAVLRASDFWKMWLRRLSPQTQVVSKEFIRILISQFIEQVNNPEVISAHEAKTLHKYVNDLAPILLHPHSHEVLKEWLEEKKEKPHWLKWMRLAQPCVNFIVHQHNCLESSWIVSYLQTLDLEKIKWGRKLIFDLGSQMSSLEMGILNTLSRHNEIEVIVPDPQWKNKFNYILNTYKDYKGYVEKSAALPEPPQNVIESKNFIRFTSEVNEIKFVTAKVREWIENKVPAENILILSPRIEDYWPILHFHLQAEGIHAQKDLVSPMISLGLIQRWLSHIQAQTKNVSWSKLEMSYVNQPQMQQFEKYKAAFAELLDDSDLARLPSIQDLFYKKINFDELLKRDEFLVEMLKSWIIIDPNLEQKKLIQGIVKDFIQQTLPLRFKNSEWFNLLSTRLAKKEIKVEPTLKSGVQVLPINSAQVLNATHRLWIGLDESGLKGKQTSLIPLADIEELKRTFDLALEYPEESHADFNLRWYAMGKTTEQVFTCAHVSMSGEPLTTSLFFLENNKAPKSVQYSPSVIDVEQMNFTPDAHPEFLNKLQLEQKPLLLNISNLHLKAISPTDLEAYDQCSFKFLARKGFRLQQLDQIGLEIDHRQKGNLIHDLFKFIVHDKNYLTLTESQLSDYLESERTRLQLFPFLDVFWKPHKDKLIAIGLKFMAAEKSRLQTLTNVRHRTEEVIQMYYDLQKNEFTLEVPQKEHFVIRGRLDRADIDESTKQSMLIDYKSAKNSSTGFASKWVANSEFQLLVYSLAVEQLFSVKNVGAIYYFYKNLDQRYGYLVSSGNAFLDHVQHTKSTLMSEADQSELYADFQTKMQQVFLDIHQNKFSVTPKTRKVCEKCEWIDTCRIKNQI